MASCSTHGTVDEVIAESKLLTYTVSGEDLPQLSAELTSRPGVDSVAPFGTSLHVSGRDPEKLEAAIAPYRQDASLSLGEVRALARGRVHRPDGPRQGQFPMNALRQFAASGALLRTKAMLIKEFIQLRRDRVSFAMIVMVPLMQLLLFGYAINTTPRDLPTAVLLQESSDLGRSILKALENTKYFKVTRQVRDEAEFDRVLASGEVLFAIEIPAQLRARGAPRRDAGDAGRGRRHRSGGVGLGAGRAVAAGADGAGARPRPAGQRRAAVRGPHPCPLQPGGGDRSSTSCRAWSAPFSP